MIGMGSLQTACRRTRRRIIQQNNTTFVFE